MATPAVNFDLVHVISPSNHAGCNRTGIYRNPAIDAGLPYVYIPMAVPPTGLWSTSLAVPANLPLGSDFATQAVYFDSGALSFGLPSTFVVH